MPPVSSRLHAAVVLVVLAVLGVLAALGLRPAEPADGSAPAGEFSAERAIARLGPVTAAVHPVGSPAAGDVRDYLLAELRGLGLQPRTDTGVAARGGRPGRVHSAGTVTDIHATLPGAAPTGRIVLAAHYDSVPTGPGAADDGANVVSILEMVRALRTGPPLRNDLELLITDGEEAGLIGAQAYVDGGGAHDAGRTVVVNMEARGTSGPAVMFQSVGHNAGLMSAVAAGGAFSASVTDDVYKLLPNITDLTVFDEAGIRGINFAFFGDSVDYHTPHDDLAHLDHASVQDMGGAALAAVRELGAADLGALPAGDDSYVTVLGLFVHYPAWLVVPLALVAVALFLVAFRYHRVRPGRVAINAATFLVPLVGAAAIGLGLWSVLTLLRPEYTLFLEGDTNRPFWYALAMSLLTVVLLIWWYRWRRRRSSMAEVAFAVLGWLAVLVVVTAFLAPGGAYLFTWPVLLGSIALIAVRRWAADDDRWQVLALGAAAAPAVVLGLPVVLLLFPLVGISLGLAPLVVVVLFGAPLLAAVGTAVPARALTIAMVVGAVAAVALVGIGLGTDTYDARHPRPVSLAYGLDGDTGKAYWITAGEPDDPATASVLTDRVPLPDFPILGSRAVIGAPAEPTSSHVTPTLQVLTSTDQGNGARAVTVLLRAGHAHDVYVFASGQDVLSAEANGAALPGGANFRGQWAMYYAAPPPDGVVLAIVVRGPGQLTLNVTAEYTGLPVDAGAPILPSDASWVLMSPLADQIIAQRSFRI